MHYSILLVVSIVFAGFLFLNFPIFAQQKIDQGSGFWVTVAIPNQQDSINVPESRHFFTLSQIKTLPVHSILLLDNKTKENIIWEGVYLREVFQTFGNINWEKINRLIIKAPDGYSSVISGMRMKQAESSLCTFARQGREWTKKFGYMRIIFPDLHEMHWMNNPAEVALELKTDAHEQRTWKFFFFDSPAFASLPSKASKETAEWPVNDIMTAMGCTKKIFAVFTGDGQLREYLFDEIAQRMKLVVDSTGTWKIRGEGVPIGFHLRKIFFFYSENVGVFTESLTPQEQLLWQELFASIHPFASQGIPAAEITLTLVSGEEIAAAHFESYQAGKISLYQLMQMEKEARADLREIDVSW